MAEFLVQGASLTAVADAIREKGGTTAPLSFPAGMAKAVRGIPSGGTDISLGLTAATVGQTVKVKAVDTDGKPTAWEAVDAARAETWEKIAEIELRPDTAKYVLADFATWRKAKVIMTRPEYISGFDKNVWCRIGTLENPTLYICGFMTGEYGQIYWDFEAEVNNLFITSRKLVTNYRNAATSIASTGIQMPLPAAPSELKFTLTFTDTSVIQEGDRVSVIGVRR